MNYQLCPHCGYRLDMDEKPKICKACQGSLSAPSAPGDVPQANTAGAVASIGAYGGAADAAWEDPAEKMKAEAEAAMPEVPAAVLAARKAEMTKRNNMIGLGVIGVFAVFVLIWLAMR